MRYYYKNKENDFYNAKIVDNPFFWLSCSFVVTVATSVFWLKGFRGWLIADAWGLSLTLFLGLSFMEAVNAKRHLESLKRIPSYLVCWFLYIGSINTAILNSRSKAAMISKSYRVLPKIWMYKDGADLFVKMEKLAGTYADDLPKLAELVSSAVGENWRVTSKVVEDDESWFKFILSAVDRKLLFVPRKIEDLRQPLYKVRLQKNWVLDFSAVHHLACFGKTGSGKSTLLWSIILQTIGNGDLYFEDFKNEYSILSSFYPRERFATTIDQIIGILERLVRELNRRKKFVAKKAQDSGVIGLTAYDLKVKPIYLFIDEWASVLSSFPTDTAGRKQRKHCENLINQLLNQSRAYAITLIYANQSPSTDILSSKDRSQFGTYVLLGSANGDTQRMVFDQAVTAGNVGRFSGYYLENTAMMSEPQRFYVPDIFRYNFGTKDIFEKIYLKGKENEEEYTIDV